ncbi:ATP-binding cassette domain-containing protein [Micromonospora sp. WMMD1082]|uniref:ABC transporter ATP-binding protein/permease n=1 Tax=Micromonospora sp. WMMD1082 TaxID=3016104 RepID=UPI002417A79B|nr:ATP-binding cassette domain-containing protein [Micromonospora sp. WMMD1082]MDG4795589.1 ATP-binding cassette domain-containing protein [Micromonospora sp. WMMD1082]
MRRLSLAFAGAGVAAVLGTALLGGRWPPHDPQRIVGVPWSGPGPGMPLGTDVLGRDLLSRLLAGGADLVMIALLIGGGAAVLGAAGGLLAAWTPGAERVVRHLGAGLLAIPGALVVLVCAVAMPGWMAVLAGMLLLGTPLSARVVYAAAAPLRASGFIQAAVARGESTAAILGRELLPAVSGTVLADAGLRMVAALQLAVAVHVLGFGPTPPAADWGLMIRENLPGIDLNPASVLAPAIAIAVVAVVLTAGLDVLAGGLVPAMTVPAPTRVARSARQSAALAPETDPPEVRLSGVRLSDGDFTFRCEYLAVRAGEVLGLVGGSGSGKSTVLRLLLGDLRPGLRLDRGELLVRGRPVVPASAASRRWRRISVGLLAQDPATTLDPLRSVGAAVGDGLTGVRRAERSTRITAILDRLGLPAGVEHRYPATLSGGQAARVALARAVIGEPALLLADEPTSGLDAATADLVRAEIDRRRQLGLTTVLVSHDRRWVHRVADRVLEAADGDLRPATAPVEVPAHASRPAGPAVLRIRDLAVAQPPTSAPLFRDFDLDLHRGELVAILGPSGVGKSTLLRALCGLHTLAAGHIELQLDGSWRALPPGLRRTARQRRAVAMLGQNPAGELNPAHRLVTAVARPARVLRGLPRGRAHEEAVRLLADVGLDASFARRRPDGCSGGQRQRAAMARALGGGPEVLLADEPTSALDAVTAHALLDLLDEHRARGLAILLVTHDDEIADRADRVLTLTAGAQDELVPSDRRARARPGGRR